MLNLDLETCLKVWSRRILLCSWLCCLHLSREIFCHQHVFCFWWFKWLQMPFDGKYLVHNALCSPRFIWSKLFVWFLIINIQILFLSLRIFSDPYARVVFGTQSQVTEILTTTICPTWDQTLIFENVQIYGSIDKVARYPPEVIIELFDKDPVVSQPLTYGEASVFSPFPRSLY